MTDLRKDVQDDIRYEGGRISLNVNIWNRLADTHFTNPDRTDSEQIVVIEDEYGVFVYPRDSVLLFELRQFRDEFPDKYQLQEFRTEIDKITNPEARKVSITSELSEIRARALYKKFGKNPPHNF